MLVICVVLVVVVRVVEVVGPVPVVDGAEVVTDGQGGHPAGLPGVSSESLLSGLSLLPPSSLSPHILPLLLQLMFVFLAFLLFCSLISFSFSPACLFFFPLLLQ